MNLTQLKLFSWLTSAGLAAVVGWTVYSYLQQRPAWEEGVHDIERVRVALENVQIEEQRDDSIVSYAEIQRTFQEFDWTGKPPAIEREAVDEGPEEPVEQPATPVAELLDVLFLNVDTRYPEDSVAQLKYQPASGVPAGNNARGLFHLVSPGDALRDPLSFIKVESITGDGVTFAFSGDDEREPETLGPASETKQVIVYVDGEAQITQRPKRDAVIGNLNGSVEWPRETRLIGRDQYAIGFQDGKDFEENYATILTRDIQHRRHRDPKTGKYDGIEITRVAPRSMAARHGAQEGDVIKSINGHPVSSVSEAINWAKSNKDKYTRWEVLVENKGKERTVVYETPPQN